MSQFFAITYTWARRCVIAVVGGTVVVIGVMMIVLPGPAFVVIPAGLAILSIEFACAKRWLQHVKTTGGVMLNKAFFWKRTGATASSPRMPNEPPSPARPPLRGERRY